MAYRETPAGRSRKLAQRRTLLKAAEGLVREQGFAGLSMQRLAERAGVAVGTVYRYFASRDALLCEVFRVATEREIAALARVMATKGSVAQRLEFACRAFAERALAAPRLAWSLIAEAAVVSLDAERLRYRGDYAALFADLLAQGVATGELLPQPVELTASALVGGLAEALLGPLATSEPPAVAATHANAGASQVDQLCCWCLRAAGVVTPKSANDHARQARTSPLLLTTEDTADVG